jgi:phage terminase large subunit-like protein
VSAPQIIRRLGRLDKTKLAGLLASLSVTEAQALLDYWPIWALAHQQMPPGKWRRWVMRAGRGGGKTYAGAKWVNELAEDRSKIRTGDIAIIARTYTDARQTCIEGSSGILATAKASFRPRWEPGNSLVVWPNGVRGRVLSADKPESIRGLNAAVVWGDEVCFWPDPEKTWFESIEPALRIGWARAILTTTPQPDPFLRKLEAMSDTVVTRASTFDNPHLSDEVLEALRVNFEGTRRGLQELYGEILDDDDRFLWRLDTIANNRVRNRPQLVRIVVAIDPAVTAKESSDMTGIIVAGIDADGHVYVLHDATMKGAPHEWAQQAIDLFKIYRADRIVAEINQGGDMVEATLRAIDPSVPYKSVRATRGKMLRAEPVAALYEQDRVHHVGVFAELEQQQCTWLPGKPSPDRLDALVWAVTELALEDEAKAGSILAYL